MRTFAITPATATRIFRHGPQNVGYSSNVIALLGTNHDRTDTHRFLESRLWVKDDGAKEYRPLEPIYHTHEGWRGELTEEMKQYLDEALGDASLNLKTYLKWIAGTTMTRDLDHWAKIGVTTPRQLADYLDGCVAREEQKGAFA